MIVPRPDDREILASLHSGPLETPLWHTFLGLLRRRVGASFCGMFFRQGDAPITESTELSVGPSYSEDMHAKYRAGFHALDPIPYDSLRPGRIYAMSDFFMPADPRHAAYMKEFLIPGGRQYMRVVKVSALDNYNAWLTLWRDDRDFSPADGDFISELVEYLTISLQVLATIERERFRARISGEAVRRLNFGWVTLDARGRVVDLEPQAEELLERSGVLRRTSRLELVPKSRQAHRQLAESLRDFAADSHARPRAIRLSDDPWIDMLLLPVRENSLSGPATPILTAFLHGDRETSANRTEQLVNLFGLTRSEARLALAMSRGRSIIEAAQELGITEQTARSYSKIVYGKTGANGQADLVRILLASVVSLA